MGKMKKFGIFFSFLLCLVFCTLILTGHIAFFDQHIYAFISSIQSDDVTLMFILVSNIIVVMTCIMFLLFFKDKKVALLVGFNLAFAYFVSVILKYIFRRNRPIGIALVVEKGYSMPSSHAFVATAFFGFIVYLFHKHYPKCIFKYILELFFIFYVLLVGISRIYLGVHYASDVVLGFAFGFLYLMFFISIYKKIKAKGEII
jgi:undecaprenyl-diphosphatase